MGLGDKIGNMKDKLMGEAKERIGGASGDKDLQAQGEAQQTKGNVKQAGENVKDAFKKD